MKTDPSPDDQQIRYRAATGADVPALRRVHAASIRGLTAHDYDPEVIGDWTTPLTPAQLDGYRAAIDCGAEPTVVAEAGRVMVGFAAVVPSLGELRAVYVAPDHARRGIGARLLAMVEQIARERGVVELHMDSSLTAAPFYAASGYETLDEAEHVLKRTGRGMRCVRMVKRLGPVPP